MRAQSTETKTATSATRVVASTLGTVVGLAGIDHGVFEILQGNAAPDSLMIEAIGPAQRFWPYGVEPALTIVPSFLITGILAVIVGVAVMVWAIAFIDSRYGAWIFLALALALFLVGGGFAPIFTAVLATLTATQMDRPLTWWRRLLPKGTLAVLGRTWHVVLVAFVVLFLVSVEIAIFGWPLTAFYDADATLSTLNTIAYIMLGFMILSPLTGLARDAHTQAEEAAYAYGSGKLGQRYQHRPCPVAGGHIHANQWIAWLI